MIAIADGFGPIADAIVMWLVAAVPAILIVSYIAATVGAKQATVMRRRPLAIFCGWLFGVAVGMITRWALLYYANSVGGLMLVPIVGTVIGGVSAFKAARRLAS